MVETDLGTRGRASELEECVLEDTHAVCCGHRALGGEERVARVTGVGLVLDLCDGARVGSGRGELVAVIPSTRARRAPGAGRPDLLGGVRRRPAGAQRY